MNIPEQKQIAVLKRLNESLETPKWVLKARKKNKVLNALVTGEGYELLLENIFTIEDDQKANLRRRFARSIKDLNERLFLPINNVFSASGGSKEYNIPTESSKRKFLKIISDIKDGKSLSQWLETYWIKTLYHIDPNGVLFMEYNKDKCYQTYKSIQKIRNYEDEGQLCQWIIFEPEQYCNKEFTEEYGLELGIPEDVKFNVWRYCDELIDCIVIEQNRQFQFIPELTFENPFGECPAIINSEMEDFNDDDLRLSPLESVIDLQQEILRDISIKIAFKFRDGIPIPWRYALICNTCKGTGKSQTHDICPDCGGYGEYKSRADVTEIKLAVPREGEQKIAPDIGGYIFPPVEIWKMFNEEIQANYNRVYETIWGFIDYVEFNTTALAKIIDQQPKINKLDKYSSVLEWVEQKISNWVAIYVNPTLTENSCLIRYGRNYILDTPETILEKYKSAKQSNLPSTVMDKMLSEYLTVKYRNNPESLFLELEKIKIEPYVHLTIDEVLTNLGAIEVKRKLLFNEWWKTLSVEKVKKYGAERLLSEFVEYFNANSPMIVSQTLTETNQTNDNVWINRYKTSLCTLNELLVNIGLAPVEAGDLKISDIPTTKMPLINKFGVNDFSNLIKLITSDVPSLNVAPLLDVIFGFTPEQANAVLLNKQQINQRQQAEAERLAAEQKILELKTATTVAPK